MSGLSEKATSARPYRDERDHQEWCQLVSASVTGRVPPYCRAIESRRAWADVLVPSERPGQGMISLIVSVPPG